MTEPTKKMEALPKHAEVDWGYRETKVDLLIALAEHLSINPAIVPGETPAPSRVIIYKSDTLLERFAAFKFNVGSDISELRLGEGFIQNKLGELIQLSKRRIDRKLEFSCPATVPGDRLILVLRIESAEPITDSFLPSLIRLALN